MQEKIVHLRSGWPMLGLFLLGLFGMIALIVVAGSALMWEPGVAAAIAFPFWVIGLFGFIVVNPNQAKVIQLFGKYVGTVKDTGFFYANPFYSTTKVSLRVHTFETGQVVTPEKKNPATGQVLESGSRHRQPSKVNDRDGTPIDIAAVVLWKVVNTAEAVFQVDKYEEYVQMQSEAALRNLASRYSYDGHEDGQLSLRGNTEVIAAQLVIDLQERMHRAGVEVIESRISYLAYAQEIASAMLRRQQATAIIAARQKIVEGAVGMVEMALDMLSKKEIVHLDNERKAAMVSNLLVVLCGLSDAQPVVNTGTIYQ
jgi:regulator of protease activity HflC (stomatin/prohibitin superfamily)